MYTACIRASGAAHDISPRSQHIGGRGGTGHRTTDSPPRLVGYIQYSTCAQPPCDPGTEGCTSRAVIPGSGIALTSTRALTRTRAHTALDGRGMAVVLAVTLTDVCSVVRARGFYEWGGCEGGDGDGDKLLISDLPFGVMVHVGAGVMGEMVSLCVDSRWFSSLVRLPHSSI
jgi:hypothetical protein